MISVNYSSNIKAENKTKEDIKKYVLLNHFQVKKMKNLLIL